LDDASLQINWRKPAALLELTSPEAIANAKWRYHSRSKLINAQTALNNEQYWQNTPDQRLLRQYVIAKDNLDRHKKLTITQK